MRLVVSLARIDRRPLPDSIHKHKRFVKLYSNIYQSLSVREF